MPKGKWTTPADRAEIIRRRQAGAHPDDLAAEFGIRHETVYRILRVPLANGHEKFRPKLAGQGRQASVDAYAAGESMQAIASRLGVDQTAVAYHLKKAAVETRSLSDAHRLYPIDESAFDGDSREANYWRGFIMADGCISDREGGSPCLIVALAAVDGDHLHKLRAFLKAGHPVTTSTTQTTYGTGQTSRLSVVSGRLCDALARCGISPRKSMTAEVIGLESDADFWRGAVDGDGFLSWVRKKNKPGCPLVGLVGSLRMVEQFADFVRHLSPSCRAHVRPMHSIYHFRTAGRHALAVARALYANAPVALDRKVILAQEVLAWTPMTRTHSAVDRRAVLAAREKAGTWGGAAELLGVTYGVLNSIRRRLGMLGRVK
jgi:hypothetical protein